MSSSISATLGATGGTGNATQSQTGNTDKNNTSDINNDTSGNSGGNTAGSTHTRLQREHDDSNRNTRGITSILQDVDKSFKGSILEISGMLALKTEHVTKGPF